MTTAQGTAHRAQGSVDPMLQVAIGQLVQAHGREAVKSACEAALKRHVIEASREQEDRIRVIIDQLRGCWTKPEVLRMLMFHKNKGIPVEISIEVLDRVVEVRPANVWGFVNTVMRKDYPTWA